MGDIIQVRNEEAGFAEFLNYDAPTIVREIDGACTILLDLDTRQIIGYRVCDPKPSPALPAVGEPVAWRWRFGPSGDWFYGAKRPAGINGATEIEPLYPASALAALQARVRELEGALKPFADRCDEGVRPDDSDNDGLTVRTKYLRAARAVLSPVQQEGGKHAD